MEGVAKGLALYWTVTMESAFLVILLLHPKNLVVHYKTSILHLTVSMIPWCVQLWMTNTDHGLCSGSKFQAITYFLISRTSCLLLKKCWMFWAIWVQVLSANRGGVVVSVEGLRGFVPFSQISAVSSSEPGHSTTTSYCQLIVNLLLIIDHELPSQNS